MWSWYIDWLIDYLVFNANISSISAIDHDKSLKYNYYV